MMRWASLPEEVHKMMIKVNNRLRDSAFEAESGMPAITQQYRPADEMYEARG